MSEKHLHIISFDIPYPPNYGGVIDVYCKLRALHAEGVLIHLHCFEYHREPSPELESLCVEVHYYPRNTGLFSMLSTMPYIVQSRRSEVLLERLLQDKCPILFEGLHSCYYLDAPELSDRYRIYRESNIEHHYYFHLSRAEKNPWRKAFFFISGLKLKAYQTVLRHADLMLAVSKEDQDYLKRKFPDRRIEYLPSFHPDDTVNALPGKGKYALYQGNLSVAENRKAAEFLVKRVVAGTGIPFVIAGMNPPNRLIKLVQQHPNVSLMANPGEKEMSELIRNAQVNILVTFQATGLKLKLLNALFNGRFCLVNPAMLAGTAVGPLCEVSDSEEGLKHQLQRLTHLEFTTEMVARRKETLLKWHSNAQNCSELLRMLPDDQRSTDTIR